jgi:hypothetical protein
MVTASWFNRFAKASSRFLAFCALASWLGFNGLFLHYDVTRPSVPQPTEGKNYPSNNHGHVVYLSERDQRQLDLLQGAAFWLFMAGAMLDYVYREQVTPGQIRSSVLGACYWLCSPSNWLASLQRLKRQAGRESKSETSHLGDFRSGRIAFRTPKSISACQKVVESAGYSAFGIVLEDFDGHEFTLSVRRNYRNSFAPICTGKLIPEATGTLIDVRLGMSPSVKLFLGAWFIGIATAGLVILSSMSENAPYSAIGVIVALLGFGILLVRFGKRLGHDEEIYVLGWLERSFPDATPHTT